MKSKISEFREKFSCAKLYYLKYRGGKIENWSLIDKKCVQVN